jgi:signal transduction histidine kinase
VTINLKLFRTSTFRLVAVYLVFFALSVGAVLGYVYWNTAGLLERQTNETIRAEVQGLAEQYRLLGLSGLADVINRRMDGGDTGTIYLLVNPEGERISGNLDLMPPNAVGEPGWIDFPIKVGKGPLRQDHIGRAYFRQLAGGYTLLVGRDVEALRLFAATIQRAVLWALFPALAFGILGGVLLSRNFLRRIDGITEATRSIMAGDLSRRMPILGGGDEIDRLSTSLNDMLSQIERLMAGMQEVSSNVAHDLKTPLTRLRARVESALRSDNKDEHKAALEKTIEESDQLLQTFNALLSIARAEAGNVREGLIPADAADIVRDVAELYEPIVEDAGGALSATISPSLPVRANRQLLAQAVSNLLDNAIKYGSGHNSGTADITIEAKSENGSAIIVVADRGLGIPDEHRARVLERFVRLDESRTKPGNGLGLSLVSSVMKLHGGTLQLGDAGPGLLARLELPLLAEAS